MVYVPAQTYAPNPLSIKNALAFMTAIFTALLLSLPMTANAMPEVGKAAPAFTAMDSQGKSVSLTDFAGKTVVMEWTNHECPFVKKFYETGTMQALQKDATADGVVWLSVISSAKDKQGHIDAATANQLTSSRAASPSHVLLDGEGSLGKLYQAKTTPHMFVIDGKGVLQYMGAMDDKPSTNHEDVKGANNYVRAALADLKAGKPVATPSIRAYGCSVKY